MKVEEVLGLDWYQDYLQKKKDSYRQDLEELGYITPRKGNVMDETFTTPKPEAISDGTVTGSLKLTDGELESLLAQMEAIAGADKGLYFSSEEIETEGTAEPINEEAI